VKIKIAILDQDKYYLERLMVAFNNQYNAETEVYLFTDMDSAIDSLQMNRIQVFLANEVFNIKDFAIPDYCAFAYLTEARGINALRGHKAICKYQKVESLYKEIMSLYANVFDGEIVNSNGSKSSKIAFLSAGAGSGASSCAIAFALNLVRKGKKVFYLNLELFNYGYIFNSYENSSLTDVIYIVKSRKSNLSIKIGALIREDSSGVHYFPACRTPLDIKELNAEDIGILIDAIDETGIYDYIVIDTDMNLSKETYAIIGKSNKAVFVLDGSEIGNGKFNYMYNSLAIVEEQFNVKILNKAVILYNRFSSRTGRQLENSPLQTIGGCPRFEGTSSQIIEQLSTFPVFDTLA